MKRIELSVFVLFVLILLTVSAGTAAEARAEVNSLEVKPANPIKGEVVIIEGRAQPWENVTIKASFGKVVPVEDGRYALSSPKINIRETVNRFTITAEGCDDLKVSIKDHAERYPHWVTLSSKASGEIVEISHANIPAVVYDILIHGKSAETSVTVTITAEGYEKADENGYFSHSYDTSSVPPGKFTVQVQNKTETVYLRLPTRSTAPVRIQESGIRGSDVIGPFQVLLVIVAFVVPIVILALKKRK